LDLITRKPKKLDLLDQEELHCRTDSKLELEAPKIVLRDDLKPFAQFQVRNSDLDSNDHVNNTRYAQWILDSIPIEWHKKFHLYEYEVNFLAETHLGNQITVLSESKDFQNNSKEWVQFQGMREKDQKMVFSARLQVSPIF
jgi:acyl-ACP thioesterase